MLNCNIKPGRINESVVESIVEIYVLYNDQSLSIIDYIIEEATDGKLNFNDCMNEFFCSKIIMNILESGLNQEENSKNLILNYYKCKEIKVLLNKAIQCQDIYRSEILRIKKCQDILNYLQLIDKIWIDDIKYKCKMMLDSLWLRRSSAEYEDKAERMFFEICC